jgi:hypothetical protein
MISLLIIRWLHHLSKNEMVILRNECDVKTESFYVQTVTGMAGQTVRNPAGGAVPEQQLIFN